jgi:uncharacterized protein DUF2510
VTAAPPPAGWFPDPGGAPCWRFWDGVAWTEQTRSYFASIAHAVGRELQLDQGGLTARADDLKLGEAVAVRLAWDGAMSRAGGDATVQADDGTWRLDQQGFLDAKVAVLEAGSGRQVGLFEWGGALRSGTLDLADGRVFRWANESWKHNRARVGTKSMAYLGTWWMTDTRGQRVVGAHLEEGVITVQPLPEGAAIPELSLLVALAAYLVMRWWDTQAT